MTMTSVTFSEFCGDPGAMLDRAERGERIEVSRDGKVIAVVAASPYTSRYDELVAQGLIKPAQGGLKAGDWDKYTHVVIPDDVDPLAILEEMREERDFGAMLGWDEDQA
jgi:prevent-host-death family protein